MRGHINRRKKAGGVRQDIGKVHQLFWVERTGMDLGLRCRYGWLSVIALSLAAVGILRVVIGSTTDSHENMGGVESIVGVGWNCL